MTGRTRQEQERPMYEEDYNPLKIPTEVKDRFLDDGKALMWVRHMIKGQTDWMNLRKAQEQEDAVNLQLMASSDSRLPISNQSRSRITTGRPQFDS